MRRVCRASFLHPPPFQLGLDLTQTENVDQELRSLLLELRSLFLFLQPVSCLFRLPPQPGSAGAEQNNHSEQEEPHGSSRPLGGS